MAIDWNVVVTTHDRGYNLVLETLRDFGRVDRTDYYNVLVVQVADIYGFLDDIHALLTAVSSLREGVARVMPAHTTFNFQSPEEFEQQARQAVLPWLPRLAYQRFFVRMHRRGFKQRLSSQEEETILDRFLLDRLTDAGTPGKIDFSDPDSILAVESVGQRAGLSLWSRTDLERFPFLHLQ